MYSLHEKGIYQSPWLKKIKSILDNCGLSYIWHSDLTLITPSWLKNTLDQKLGDIFKQNWSGKVNASGSCANYRIFKTNLNFEKYLVNLNQRDRISLCKFRCGNNKLPITTGRYQKTEIHDRICTICKNSQIGDEFHYILECPTLDVERHMYLKPYYRIRGNTLKMNALMNSENSSEMSNLAKFCRCIMNKFE